MFRLSRIFFKMLYAVFSVVLASALASPRPDTITIKEIIGAEKVCLASFPPELKGNLLFKCEAFRGLRSKSKIFLQL